MNINFCVDKAYESKTLKEIAKSPVDAIQGISERQANLLYEAFKIKTVEGLANVRFVKWAQAICTLAEGEE